MISADQSPPGRGRLAAPNNTGTSTTYGSAGPVLATGADLGAPNRCNAGRFEASLLVLSTDRSPPGAGATRRTKKTQEPRPSTDWRGPYSRTGRISGLRTDATSVVSSRLFSFSRRIEAPRGRGRLAAPNNTGISTTYGSDGSRIECGGISSSEYPAGEYPDGIVELAR